MCGFCSSRRQFLLATPAVLLAGCSTNSTLDRRQLMLVSQDQLAGMSEQTWQDAKSSQTISQDPTYTAAVERVMARLAAADTRTSANFEIAVFEDDNPNAWVLPGGKVGVNTGMFKVARTDGQLAAVLGHERGHVLAKHSAERLSQTLAAQVGQQALSALAGATYGADASKLAAQAFGLGAKYGLLMPYGRQQELEADKIGLRMMARAGYAPHEAVDVWKNMIAEGNRRPPEFLSTHPSPSTRIEELQREISRL